MKSPQIAPSALAFIAMMILLAGLARLGANWSPPPPPPDGDNDGLLDAWEIQYFGDLTQTGGGDYDGDGVTNLEEFQLGRNPNAAALADTGGLTGLLRYTPLE